MKNLRLCIIGNMLGRNPGYVTSQGQILGDLLSNEGYLVSSASSRVNRFLRLIEIIETVVRNRKVIDIVILEVYSGMNFLVSDIVGRLARLFSLPTIFVLHGGNLPQFSRRHPRWTMSVLKRANKLIAPSNYLARELRTLGLPIMIIENVVNLNDYHFRLRNRAEPKLLWMRAFHHIYNPHMAVSVFEVFKSTFPNASLVMAGVDKGLELEVKKMVEAKGLLHSVRFPGFLDQRAKIREFSDADIFLNTNRIDNMPVAVIEALAMGVPVVATSVGGIPDLIRDREDGMLVPDGDVWGMADAVCTLIDNPDMVKRLSGNGRSLAERSGWATIRLKWNLLLAEVAGSARLYRKGSSG